MYTKFQINLHKKGTHVEDIVKMICNHNGGDAKIDLDVICGFVLAKKAQYPTLTDGKAAIKTSGDNGQTISLSDDDGETFYMDITENEYEELQVPEEYIHYNGEAMLQEGKELLDQIKNAVSEMMLRNVTPYTIGLNDEDYTVFINAIKNLSGHAPHIDTPIRFQGIPVRNLKEHKDYLLSVHPNLSEGFIADQMILNEKKEVVYFAKVFTLKTLTEVHYTLPQVFSEN